MEVFLDFVKRMTCYLIVVTVASTLLLEVFDYERYILGWVWGCAINLLYLLILGLWGYKLRHKELRTIEKATKLGTLIRITRSPSAPCWPFIYLRIFRLYHICWA